MIRQLVAANQENSAAKVDEVLAQQTRKAGWDGIKDQSTPEMGVHAVETTHADDLAGRQGHARCWPTSC